MPLASQDVPGWCDFEPLYADLADRLQGDDAFVEIGCWFGRSLIYLGEQLARHGRSKRAVQVYGVDHGLGTLAENPYYGHMIHALGGSSAGVLARNVVHAGLADRIVLIVADSQRAAQLFGAGTLAAVFIDSDHSAPAVSRDLDTWYGKVRPGGLIAGHDYQVESVRAAVDEFFAVGRYGHSLQSELAPSCWCWTKPE